MGFEFLFLGFCKFADLAEQLVVHLLTLCESGGNFLVGWFFISEETMFCLRSFAVLLSYPLRDCMCCWLSQINPVAIKGQG